MTNGGRAGLPGLLLAVCLIYLMLRPVSSPEILYPVIAVIGLVSCMRIVGRNARIHWDILTVVGITFGVAVLGLFVGASNPGVLNSLLTWLIAPLIFWLWAIAMDVPLLQMTITAAAFATVVLSVLILVYVGSQLGAIPDVVPHAVLEETGAGFDGTGGSTAIRLYGLSTLVAAAPMWTASLFVRRHQLLPDYAVRVVAAASAVGAAVVGGRRAIVLLVVLTPLIVLFLRLLMQKNQRRRVILHPVAFFGTLVALAVGAMSAPSILSNANITDAFRSLADLFNSSSTSADTVARQLQIEELINGAADSPIWGNGFGAVLSDGYARSDDRPWAFEMQYHLLFFNVGFLGVLLMGLAAFHVLRAVRRAALRRPDMTPVLTVVSTAAVAMVIGNASDPYLQAPGHMWPLFLCIGATNLTLLRPFANAEPTLTIPKTVTA